jgi:hypothetical protein
LIFIENISQKIWILLFSVAIFALRKFNDLLKMLSRKAEGLDPLKP